MARRNPPNFAFSIPGLENDKFYDQVVSPDNKRLPLPAASLLKIQCSIGSNLQLRFVEKQIRRGWPPAPRGLSLHSL